MDNREANSTNHPPACTCVECVNKRLTHFNNAVKFNTQHKNYRQELNKNIWTPIPSNDMDKQQIPKHRYPAHIRAISNIILSLGILLIIAVLGGAGYAVSKYHNEAWNWASQSYVNITNNVSSWFSSVSMQNTESLTTTTPQITKQTTQTTQVTKQTTQTTQVTTKSAVIVKSFESMFNDYRVSSGLLPLEFTEDLNRVAKLRLEEIKINYNHTSIGGYNKHLGENINWISSSGHRANILNPSYKYTGYANGGGYAVQVFAEYTTINGEPQLPPGWHWAN